MKTILLFIFLLITSPSFSQEEIPFNLDDFKLTADAVRVGENCFQLTAAKDWESGTVWYKKQINLEQNFELEMDLNFGCSDWGADGMVFLFHDKLKTGRAGGGIGFGQLVPSFGVEMDTYQNHDLDDPSFDHIALLKNGSLQHQNGITSPISILPHQKNIEDCKSHHVKILWNPESKIIQISIDGNQRISRKVDIVNSIFKKNPNVYWGFSAATGGSNNLHQVCFKKMTFKNTPVFDLPTKELLLEGKTYALKDVNFLSGKIELEPVAFDELEKLLQLLKANPQLEIFINGHTDSSGGATQNKVLSQKRADIVMKYLIENGISQKRIKSKGFGEAFPKANNSTAKGRSINRRIEVFLLDPRA